MTEQQIDELEDAIYEAWNANGYYQPPLPEVLKKHCLRKPAEPITASEFLGQVADAIEGQDRIIRVGAGKDAIVASVRPGFIAAIREGKLNIFIDLPMAHEANESKIVSPAAAAEMS